jgi:starch phosphorylase
VFRLKPETFGTVPIYLLSTDIPGNPEHIRALTQKLYDGEQRARISQEIILGVGGYRALKAAGEHIDIVHLNEGHALPAAFEMLGEHNGNHDEVRQRLVFTTHTPVAAGNESHPVQLLSEAGFFVNTSVETARWIGGDDFSLTVAALKLSRVANGVSQLHGHVANNMWEWVDGRCQITAITNAVNHDYWQDPRLRGAVDLKQLVKVKKQMKQELLDYVAQQTGTKLSPRRFDHGVVSSVYCLQAAHYDF